MISDTQTPLLREHNQPQKESRRRLFTVLFAVILCVFIVFLVVFQPRESLSLEQLKEGALLTSEPQKEDLLYVFELNRHGERGEQHIWNDTDTYGFSLNDMGQLTPIGMRQRYLLGKWNYHHFQDKFNMTEMMQGNVGKKMNPYATIFYRTIQSTYSELMGHTEMSTGQVTLNTIQSIALNQGSRGIPPFVVRNRTSLSSEKVNALKGFIQIPTYTLIANSIWAEPCFAHACQYHNTIDNVRYSPTNNEPYIGWKWMQEIMIDTIKEELGLDEEATNHALEYFPVMVEYNDAVINKRLDLKPKDPIRVNYTPL